MRKTINIIKVLALAGVLAACQDPEYPTPVASTTVRSAKLTLINAAPDAGASLSFLVNNNSAASINFPGGSVVSINPTVEQFRLANVVYGVVGTDTLSQKGDLVSQTTATAIQGNGSYTLIATDTVKRPFSKGTGFATGKGGLTFVSLITDNLTAPTAGNSGIRFLNLAPGAPAVFLTAGGSTLAGTLSNSRTYKTTTGFTSFTAVTAGSYNLEVRTGSASGTIIATLPSTALADGKLYTIFLSGKAVKIGSSTVVKVPYAVNVVPHN